MWLALTAGRRDHPASMYLIAALFTGRTIVRVTGAGGVELSHDGDNARSAALGLLLLTGGLLSARPRSLGHEQREP